MYKTSSIAVFAALIVLAYVSRGFGKTVPNEAVPKETVTNETVSKETVSKETVTKETVSDETVSNILILGGNGMLGSAAVLSLLNDTIKYNITILNRGNWYWDTEKIIKPHVTHLQCTRGEGFREDCTQLENATFDTIIDFSSYDPMDVEDILIVLGGRFKRYIYISTDSVYEVCAPKNHDGFTKEQDAVRPKNNNSRMDYSRRDDYGHKKFEGEEALNRFHKDINYEYIFLRLPDVIGPRDNTVRFYKYFIWTKMHNILPVHIPDYVRDKQMSFVYSVDVGSLIAKLANPNVSSKIFNHEYNLAFQETITLKDFVTFIGDWLKQGPTKFDESDAAYIHHGFPSITRGPINIKKATAMLKWSPTPLYKAMAEICTFYETMQYDNTYKYILDRVLDKLDIRGDKYSAFVDLHWTKLENAAKAVKTEL